MTTPERKLLESTMKLAHASVRGDNEQALISELVTSLLPHIAGKSAAIKEIAQTILESVPEEYPDHQQDLNILRELAGLPPQHEDTSDEEVEEFFMELSNSGEINMFGAAPHLMSHFGMSREVADKWVIYLMSQ